MRLMPRSYSSKLALVGLGMLVLFFFLGVLQHIAGERNLYHLQRIKLANQVHAEYLLLSRQTYGLFKQLVDATISSDSSNQAQAAEKRESIESTLDRIRLLIAAEVALVGDEEELEKDELVSLATIERKLQAILSELEEVLALLSSGRPLTAEAKMVRTLEQSIDKDFRHLIGAVIDEEAAEVAAAERSALRLMRVRNLTEQLALIFALALTLAALFALRKDFRQRIERLQAANQALASGNLSHRLPVGGGDEFASIAEGFNRMAIELQHQQTALEQARAALETEVGETSQELRKANEALLQHDKLRQQFFADISHELRTPVTVIRGESQFALRGEDKSPVEYKDALQRVLEQSHQLGRLVDDLLYIARTSAGLANPNLRPVTLAPLLEQVCDDARVIAAPHEVAISCHIETPDLVILGDEGRLRQLLLILLENAVCYSQSGGRVEVTLAAAENGTRIDVVDTGVGIAPEDQHRVMERFYRGNNAIVVNANGSGLGLPVAKAIVEAHRGQISLTSQIDCGTRVTVSLPGIQQIRAVS